LLLAAQPELVTPVLHVVQRMVMPQAIGYDIGYSPNSYPLPQIDGAGVQRIDRVVQIDAERNPIA
jgi:hypothetical protein